MHSPTKSVHVLNCEGAEGRSLERFKKTNTEALKEILLVLMSTNGTPILRDISQVASGVRLCGDAKE